MGLISRADGATGFADMDDTVVVPSVANPLDTLFNQLFAAVNSLDNANFSGNPKLAGTKVDLTTGGYLPLDGSADMSANMNHAFDGVFRTMRASGNGRIREYRGSDGAIWGVSYNTYWTGSAWAGRDVTDVCTVLKMESNGLHYYHAVSAGVGVVPTWTELFKVDTSGIITANEINVINTNTIRGVNFLDHFLLNSAPNWTVVVSGSVLASTQNGVLRVVAPSAGAEAGIHNEWSGFILSGGNTITFEARIKNDVECNGYGIGLSGGTFSVTSPANAIWFSKNGANFIASTRSGSTPTETTITSGAPTSTYKKYKIIATASSVTFYIDDVLKATHTTNIPTAVMGLILGFQRTSVGASNCDIDYIFCNSNSLP